MLRLMGIDPNQNDEDVSEEDIRMMVDVGTQTGAIDDEEKEFIQNVFEFDDLTAGEIATHRTEVAMLWTDEPMEEWNRIIHETRHAIYPVCHESVDDIVGVLNSKDYFRLESRDRETVMAEAVRPAYFIPEGVKADLLFRNMKKSHNKFAIVLDEYGGKVPDTMEDLLKLPGVGRKTANLILGDVYHVPGVVVADTHCIRISGLLGLTDGTKDPAKTEYQLREVLPPEESNDFCHRMVLHGRALCMARGPQCGQCPLRNLCDYGRAAE
jgi:endonuclease III-like uncharacterized protein